MKKIETLNKNRQFRRVYYKGHVWVTPILVIYVLKNNLGENRLGITASKKVGKAVIRNRAKRKIKAAFSEIRNTLPVGFDVIFVARKRTAETKSTQIKPVMLKSVRTLMNK